ncbi:MAG: hypothetical protein ACLFTR_02995 [Candidatus Woesearchaeota archaeon]
MFLKRITSFLTSRDVILFLVAFIAIFILFFPVLRHSEFHDANVERILMSQMDISEMFSSNFDSGHPPLMYLFYHYYLSFFDNIDDFVEMMPILVFFALAMSVFLVVGRKFIGLFPVLFSFSIFILATHNTLTDYLTRGIDNMFMFIFFAILSLYFFYKAFMLHDEKAMWPLVIFDILLIWTYHASVFMIFGQFLFILFHRRKQFFVLKNVKYVAVFIITSLPVFFNLFYSILNDSVAAPIGDSSILEIGTGFINHLHVNKFHFTLLRDILSNFNIYTSPGFATFFHILLNGLVFLGLILFFIVSFRNERYRLMKYYLFPFLIIIPLYIILRASSYEARYSLAFSWLIFMASGVVIILLKQLFIRITSKRFADFVIGVFVIFILFSAISNIAFDYGNESIYKPLEEDFTEQDVDVLLLHDVDDFKFDGPLISFMYYTAENHTHFTELFDGWYYRRNPVYYLDTSQNISSYKKVYISYDRDSPFAFYNFFNMGGLDYKIDELSVASGDEYLYFLKDPLENTPEEILRVGNEITSKAESEFIYKIESCLYQLKVCRFDGKIVAGVPTHLITANQDDEEIHDFLDYLGEFSGHGDIRDFMLYIGQDGPDDISVNGADCDLYAEYVEGASYICELH